MTAQYMPDGLDPAGAVYQAYEAAGFIPAPGSNGHANVIIEETLTWESLTRPCYNNRADEATALRLLMLHGQDLVLVKPELTGKGNDFKPGQRMAVFAVNDSGMLSVSAAASRLHDVGRWLVAEAYTAGLDKDELAAVSVHALKYRNARGLEPVELVMQASLDVLRRNGLEHDAEIADPAGVDSTMYALGTPDGVLHLRTGEMLAPHEARRTLTVSSIPDSYDVGATHRWVDDILPPLAECRQLEEDGDPWPLYRAEVLAYSMLNPPRRQMMLELCAAGSGKSTFLNALRKGLGPYVTELRAAVLREPDKAEAGGSAHNGDVRLLMAPARLTFCQEWRGAGNIPLLKAASGGDAVPYRRIREEDTIGQPTAHIWIMGNDDPDAGNRLGLSDDDDSGDAMRDRIRLLHRERRREIGLEEDDRVVNYGLDHDELRPGDARLFRQAVVSRVVEYCTGGGRAFPAELGTQGDLLRRRQEDELPAHTLWLRNAVRPAPHGELLLPDLLQAYEDQRTEEDPVMALEERNGVLSLGKELRKAVRRLPKTVRRGKGPNRVTFIPDWELVTPELCAQRSPGYHGSPRGFQKSRA